MDDIPRTSGDEHGESCISTVQELTSYFSENRNVAAALVRAMADLALSDGLYPIRDILEKGYEDSFYLDDLMGLSEEFETMVRTPMIETTSDWDQPFEDHDFQISVHGFFEGIEVSEELASDLGHCLSRECLNLVEERGKARPNSGFVDIFGQKVFEVFQEKLEEKRAEELRSQQEWEQEMERQRGRLRLLDQLLVERREFEREFDQHWLPELERQLASDLRDPWTYVHHWLIEQQLELDRLLELQENRYRDIDQEREEFEEEHEQEKGTMLREVFSDSIEDAVPLIAEWMKDTIEAEGESLVFNALKGMSS